MAPTVVGPLVIVGSCAGALYALDWRTGEVAWELDVSIDGASQFHGNPVVAGDRLWIGTDEGSEDRGSVYALDPRTGELAWKRRLDPGLPSDVCLQDSTLLVISKDDAVWALAAGSGRERWRFQAPADADAGFWRLVSSPVLVDGLLIYGDRDRRVHALETATGELRWSKQVASRITTQPCVLDSLVAFGTREGSLVVFRATDGQIRTTQELPWIPTATMSARGDTLFFLASDETDQPRDVVALDWKRRETLWIASLDDPEASWFVPRLHFWDDAVLVGSTKGLLVAYDISSGEERWRIQLQGALRGIGSTPEQLFVGNLQGLLFALRHP